jgi:hypothetical protein
LGFINYKGVRNPEFQESAEIKRRFYQEYLSPEQATQRFEHYELVNGQDGKPVELGCGAMGVTYKALDVDLHCPVTLKVISERYLGDESARLRFLREARAAASVRHPMFLVEEDIAFLDRAWANKDVNVVRIVFFD